MEAQEIYPNLEKVIKHYIDSLGRYSEEQFQEKPSEEDWSIGQMYEHLVSSAFFFIKQINNCLNQENGSLEGEKNEHGIKSFEKYNSLPPIKITVPKAWRGPDPIAKAKEEYKATLEKLTQKYQDLIELVDKNEHNYKNKHAAFGMLNAKEWYQNAEMHFRHHLRQQKEREEWLKIED